MAETRELYRFAAISGDYMKFADSMVDKHFIISGEDLAFIKLLQGILYQEQRLNADNQRDIAQTLEGIIERTLDRKEVM